MTELYAIEAMTFDRPLVTAKIQGAPGKLAFINLAELVIDRSYQRPVMGAGTKNIRRIAEEFNWSYFAPLVVAPRPGGKYAIIDGQHKALAAKARGDIAQLPCLIITADHPTQARAFAVINGQVTKLSAIALFRSRLTAGDAAAVEIQRAAERAGVTIAAYLKSPKDRAKNETFAIGSIETVYHRYGLKALECALSFLVQADAGELIGKMAVRAVAACMGLHPLWMARPTHDLVSALGKKGFRRLYEEAIAGRSSGDGYAHFTALLAEKFAAAFGPGVKKVEPAKPPVKLVAVKSTPRAAEPGNVKTLTTADLRRPQVPVKERAKDRVSDDERALIDAHLAEKGARVLDSGATGNTSCILDWLCTKGHAACRRSPKGAGRFLYEIDGKKHDLNGLFAFTNKVRKKHGLQPLTSGEVGKNAAKKAMGGFVS